MADIIRLRDSPHERTECLLPWYVNGTLEAEEASQVEAHLAECAECRDALEAERLLALRVASAPLDVEHGWAILDDRLADRPQDRPLSRQRLPRFVRRRATLVWAATAQLAAAALVLVAFTSVRQAPAPVTYHALGSAPARAGANAVVLFAPETKEREMRTALQAAGARLVDGPTETGAFLLKVADSERNAALSRLRRSSQVLLAEPLDPAGQP